MDRWQRARRGLSHGTSRRAFLKGALASVPLLALGSTFPDAGPAAQAGPDLSASPFTLGVASGDPLPDGVVLWTRLAPDPLNGGRMPDRPVTVEWEVAEDEAFQWVIQRGAEEAEPRLAHSVHAEVQGLEPAHWYWYRFRVASLGGRADAAISPVGRTRTAPALDSSPERLRFAFASCQDYQAGFYPAYRRMAEEDLDLVVHLGDYIYEDGVEPDAVRPHEGPEVFSLEAYRNRHALYRLDPALQAAHAAFPWVVTWDDHDVDSNYAGLIPDPGSGPHDFALRRAAAYQAYYEHLPLRRSSLPNGPDMPIYRRLTFGDLAELSVLDTRQYRTDQPCGDGLKERCPAALDGAATMSGPEQERWLLEGLDRSRARWNVVAQQTMLAQFDFDGRATVQMFNMDQWDGYVAARNRILGFLLQRRPSNPVVITGDLHSSWVLDLKANFDDPASPVVGTELVGPSISSGFPPRLNLVVAAALADNPHVRFFNGTLRGYVRCDLDRGRWRADYRMVSSVRSEDAPISTLASFEVQDGRPGAVAV